MTSIRVPQLLEDLYGDLRDRRLLLPAAALVVALVAVPMVLASPAPEPVAPVPAAAPEGVLEVEPAVLAGDPGIRDYRKRLAALKSSNPFKQKFAPPPAETAETAAAGASAGSTAVDGGSTAAPSTPELAPPSDTDTITPPVADSDDPADETTPDEATTEEPAIRYYSSRIDVSLGPVGHGKQIESVKVLEMLPDKQRPLVIFLGIGESGEEAIFLVSSDVTATDGEGSCSPKPPARCQFLTLGEKESRYLDYGPSQKRYRLALNEIHLVEIPEPNGVEQSERPSAASGKAVLSPGL